MSPHPATEFKCSLCKYNCSEAKPRIINENFVCKDCVTDMVVPLFHKALQYEFAYPVEWDHFMILDPDDFAEDLGKDFIARFEQVEKDYHCPPSERVYCKNLIKEEDVLPRGQKRFLMCATAIKSRPEKVQLRVAGHKIVECGAFVRARKENDGGSFFVQPYCRSCGGKACSNCGDAVFVHTAIQHRCRYVRQKPVETFVGPEMIKGKDYQVCPNPECGTIVQLHDGCNSMMCKQTSCNTSFCFLCAAPVRDDDLAHWRPGNPCPRFGQPGTSNAIWDSDPAEDAPELEPDEDMGDAELEWVDFVPPEFRLRGPRT